MSTPQRARIFTLPFTLVVSSGLCYFTALAMLTPVLPDYVEKSLGHGSIAVGIAVGAFAVGAIILRPFAGRIGDSVGRRVSAVDCGVSRNRREGRVVGRVDVSDCCWGD